MTVWFIGSEKLSHQDLVQVNEDVQAACEAAVAAAWFWPEAAEVLMPLKFLYQLCGTGESSDLVPDRGGAELLSSALSAVSRANRAVAENAGIVAIGWGTTDQLVTVLPKDLWLEQALDAGPDDPPLLLWVAMTGKTTEQGSELFTTGLVHFGKPEVEVTKCTRDPEYLLEAVCDTALFLITNPDLPEEGSQLELSNAKVRVRYGPGWRGLGRVLQLGVR